MPRLKRVVVRCEKCNSEFEVSESFARNMKFCPACSCMLKPSREDIKKDIMLWVYTYIDSYGMDFVLDTIKSIKVDKDQTAESFVFNKFYGIR